MMSDLSNTLRNMKFMKRTVESRKKLLKKPSFSTTQSVSILPSAPIIITPDHPGCWRILKNEVSTSASIPTVAGNHPSITYRQSVFSVHDRNYTRLSFQNYNKRIEPLMIKYGLREETNALEDGEIDPDDDDERENEVETTSRTEENDSKPVSTLVKTIRKKFTKKPFSRTQFDNKSRITKRRRRTRHGTSSN